MTILKRLFAIQPPTLSTICYADSGDGGGDGGAGGQGGGGDPAPAFTSEQQAFIGRVVNAAVTSHIERKLNSTVDAAVNRAVSPLSEKLDILVAGAGNKPNPNDGGGGQSDPAVANQLKAMQERMNASEQRAKDLAATRRKERAESKLLGALTTAGVRKELLPGASATLFSNIIIPDDDEKPAVWRAQRNGYHEDLEISAGVAEWTKTDAGKAHLAPISASGSGAGRPGVGGGPRPGATPTTPEQARKMRKAAARQNLRQQIGAIVSEGGQIALTGRRGDE